MIFWTLFALLIVELFRRLYKKWRLYNYLMNNFKSSPTRPILGSLHLFPSTMPGVFETLQKLVVTYGKRFILSGPLWEEILVISDAKDIEAVLANLNTKKAKKGDFYRSLEPWLGTGLLTSHGDKWFRRRKITSPSFHFRVLEVFADIINKQSNILTNHLEKHVGKGEFDIYPIINAFALDVICETSMGVVVNAQDDPLSEYVTSVKSISTALIERRIHPLGKFKVYSLTRGGRRLKQLIKILHNFTEKVIEERRNQLLSNNTADKGSRMNFLDILLHATIDGKPLTNDDIREEVDTFMFAGHDTTASGIAFTLYLLAKNSDVQEKVYQEVVDVFGSKSELKITTNKLNELTYMDMVIKESLRMFPPAAGIVRELMEDTVIGGVTVPVGVNLGIFIYGVHHDPDYYPNPEEFNPERFNPSNGESRKTFSYLPFSAGGRNCIGQKYAILEIKISVAKVLMNFKLLPGPDVVLQSDIILKASNGILVSLEAR